MADKFWQSRHKLDCSPGETMAPLTLIKSVQGEEMLIYI